MARFGDAGWLALPPSSWLRFFFSSSLSIPEWFTTTSERERERILGAPIGKIQQGKGETWTNHRALGWRRSARISFCAAGPVSPGHPLHHSTPSLSLFLAAAPFSFFFPSSQVGYLRSISLYARKSPSRFLYSSMMMENIHLMENFFSSLLFLIYYRILFLGKITIGAGGSVTLWIWFWQHGLVSKDMLMEQWGYYIFITLFLIYFKAWFYVLSLESNLKQVSGIIIIITTAVAVPGQTPLSFSLTSYFIF